MAENDFQMTRPAEIAFPPYLFEKSEYERYELALLMAPDHPDLEFIESICYRLAEQNKSGPDTTYPWSIADGAPRIGKNGKQYDNSRMAGKIIFRAHKKDPPKLSVAVNGLVVDYWDDVSRQTVRDKFYMGGLVLVEFGFKWWPPKGRPATVTAYVNKACSLNAGKRLGGGKSGQETFGAHVGRLSSVDPTAADAALEY